MEFVYDVDVTPPDEPTYPMQFVVRAVTQAQADARAEQLRQILMKMPTRRVGPSFMGSR